MLKYVQTNKKMLKGKLKMMNKKRLMAILAAGVLTATSFNPGMIKAESVSAEEAGMVPPLKFIPAGVSVTTRETKDTEYLFIQNYARKPQAVPVPREYETIYGRDKSVLNWLETRILKRQK